MRALDIAATGMLAQQLNVEVISNNLSNMSTTGFKRQRAEFKDLLYQTVQRAGTQGGDGSATPTGIQLGLGVRPGAIYRIQEQGVPQETKAPLDITIQGKGFFVVDLPSGEQAYTRAGSFQLSPEGEIITQEGYTVSPGISIPAEAVDFSISKTGLVTYKLDGETTAQEAGTLELANFINPNGLQALGDNLYLETTASGEAQTGAPGDEGFGTSLQGYLENSNVDPVKEITTLIVAQRAYEMNSKVISASDQMLQTASNIRS